MTKRKRKSLALTYVLFGAWLGLAIALFLFQLVFGDSQPLALVSPVSAHADLTASPSGYKEDNKYIPASPTPTVAPLSPTVEQLIKEAFRDQGEKIVDQALKVARCESGQRPHAINIKNKNKSKDIGVFQINSVHGVNSRFLYDPRVNVAVARKLFDEQGWQPWYSSRKCHGL